MAPRINVKRVYEPPAPGDGRRILVERLWPRGIRKADLMLDRWAKELGASDALRRWFGHSPEKWPEFQRPGQRSAHSSRERPQWPPRPARPASAQRRRRRSKDGACARPSRGRASRTQRELSRGCSRSTADDHSSATAQDYRRLSPRFRRFPFRYCPCETRNALRIATKTTRDLD